MKVKKVAAVSAHDELLALMADFAADYLDPAFKKKQAGEVHHRPTDTMFEEIFRGFTEIGASMDTLELLEELLKAPPSRRKAIRKDRYLKFLIGSYLQEMYILEQRMTAYGKKISRLYGARPLPAAIKEMVYTPLENLISVRGAHVHERRFSDEHLDRLGMFATLNCVGHTLGEHLEDEYFTSQITWAERVSKNNKSTRKIIDQYCAMIKPIITDSGKIFIPKKV